MLDLRVEAIHVLSEPNATPEQTPGYEGRRVPPPVATPPQSARLHAQWTQTRDARNHAAVIGFQRTSRSAR